MLAQFNGSPRRTPVSKQVRALSRLVGQATCCPMPLAVSFLASCPVHSKQLWAHDLTL